MTGLDTHLLLRAFAEELARAGVRAACTSPGARSAPLVLALAREPGLETFSHLDERSAGFFALGLARASGAPVVLACTSGTAVANLAPAVFEAREARIPLIVLSADRPPELRDTGAGQTIDQVKLFGGAVKWFFEVGTHEATAERGRWMRRLACRAVAIAREGRPGPVHLNFPLREPLVTGGPLPAEDPFPGRPDNAPWLAAEPSPPAGPALELPARGVLVAGGDPRGDGAAAAAWAERAGWPVLADPPSGARRGEAAIAHYDHLLRSPGFAAAQEPECVARIGDLPTSKPLRTWLAGLACPQIAIDPEAAWQDPDAVTSAVHPGPLDALRPEPSAPEWLRGWRAADAAAAAAIDAVLGEHALSEPGVARALSGGLGAGEILWVASSMPIRDVESFAPARDDGPRVFANRGANGIDGTVSSAFGAAARAPTTLLTGDLALLHDVGGLIAHRRLGLTLRLVVLDNDGGGIFSFLPVAGEEDVFEGHVATPHGLDLERVAAAFELPYTSAASLADLGAPGFVHVRTDRTENLALHRRIADAVEDAFG